MPSCTQNQAKSRIGRYSPRVNLLAGETFIAVRAYLDSSGKRGDRFVTLAAFAATDDTWGEFEQGWDKVLKGGFRPAPWMHMVEAVHLKPGFPFSRAKGWDRDKVWELVLSLAKYMAEFRQGALTMHTCEIHMDAWRKLTARGYTLHSEVEICNCYVCEFIVAQFAKQQHPALPAPILPKSKLLNFVFDRNEPFFPAFSRLRNAHMELCNRLGVLNSPWGFVDGITEGYAQTTPGLQAADMLAWGINRENIASEGKQGKYLAHILRQLVFNTQKTVDESFLRQRQTLPGWY
jgi:hypothetical protein